VLLGKLDFSELQKNEIQAKAITVKTIRIVFKKHLYHEWNSLNLVKYL
jgi:hypothetical protein